MAVLSARSDGELNACDQEGRWHDRLDHDPREHDRDGHARLIVDRALDAVWPCYLL